MRAKDSNPGSACRAVIRVVYARWFATDKRDGSLQRALSGRSRQLTESTLRHILENVSTGSQLASYFSNRARNSFARAPKASAPVAEASYRLIGSAAIGASPSLMFSGITVSKK